MKKPTLSVTLESDEEKELILSWAKTRGINRGADLLRIALFEYIRRKLPKDPLTVPQQRLRGIVVMADDD